MNFEQSPMPPTEDSGENQAERVEINDTTSFQKSLESGNLEAAESWLDKIKAERPENYDERWIDHRERELFKAYYQQQKWIDAKRIVENSIRPDSKKGRADRLAELSGIRYEEI